VFLRGGGIDALGGVSLAGGGSCIRRAPMFFLLPVIADLLILVFESRERGAVRAFALPIRRDC
jgi:hypothetical protein